MSAYGEWEHLESSRFREREMCQTSVMSQLFYPDSTSFKFGAYIRMLREQRNLSMQDVVARSGGRLSTTSLSVIERDLAPSIPSARILDGLGEALELPTLYLFALAYISERGLDPASVERIWEEFDLSGAHDAPSTLSVPRFQRERLNLAADEVSFYLLDSRVRISLEASRLEYVVPNDVVAVDRQSELQPGSLMLGFWTVENALLLYRHKIDEANILVQARNDKEAHHRLSSISLIEELGRVVWRCGQVPG